MQRRVFLFVVLTHFVCLLVVWKSPLPVSKPPSKVFVHTKILPKSAPLKTVATSAPTATKSKKTAPAPKKKAGKAHELLKQLESNLASIEANLQKVEKPKPLTVQPIQIEGWEKGSSHEEPYFETIVAIFRQSLTLPEIGAVKVSITVQPNGEIVSIEPISVKSEENLRYLEKMLPHIRMPPPPSAASLVVTITFCETQV